MLRVLDADAIGRIHDAALVTLETIGMDIAGDGPRRVLLEAGAREQDGRLLLCRSLVDSALSQVPRRGFELVGRDPGRRVRIAPGRLHFRPAGGLPFTIDRARGDRRLATMKDAERIVRLTDALDGIDIVNSAVSPPDTGVGLNNVHRFVNAVRHSTKPIDITASSAEEVAAIHEIAVAVRGSRKALEREPLVLLYISPTSPLRLSEDEGLAVMACAARGMPLGPLSCPTLAATAPATMAGGLAQQWAEELALVVLAYGIRPGLPVMACSRINPVDMRRGTTILSGAAPGLMTAAFTDLAASFHLACNGWGFSSASHAPDLQAGAERATGTLLAALSGTSVISGAGTLGNALITTAEQLVIDNEIIAMVRSACEGVLVTDDALAQSCMAEGVREGTFLASRHTVDHLRSGRMWMADLFATEPYETWLEKGEDLMDRARARLEDILAGHEVPPLDRAVAEEIESVLNTITRPHGV